MPTATVAPKTSVKRRILVVPPMPPRSPEDLARLRALAADTSEPEPDEDSPDITAEPGRFVEVAPPYEVLRIPGSTLAWFSSHGGVRVVNQVLRDYIRAHRTTAPRSRRRSGAKVVAGR